MYNTTLSSKDMYPDTMLLLFTAVANFLSPTNVLNHNVPKSTNVDNFLGPCVDRGVVLYMTKFRHNIEYQAGGCLGISMCVIGQSHIWQHLLCW